MRFHTVERGQSAVVGFTLLIGLTVVVTGLVLVIGSAALADTEQAARMQHAESAFTQLDAKASQVALGGGDVQTVDLGLDTRSEGVVEARPTGRLVIVTDDGTEYVNQTLGTVVYETDDDVVAYQGGGVWRGTGNDTVMVSPPEFHYRDGTLTLPLVVASPKADTSAGLTIRANGSRTGIGPGTVDNGIVTVKITGRYYMGWARFFRTRIDGVTVDIDHANQTVTADLAQLEIDGDYRTGLVGDDDIDLSTPGTVHSRIRSGGSVNPTPPSSPSTVECDGGGTGADCWTENADIGLTSLDLAIEQLVNQSEDNDPDANINGGPRTLSAGSYYSDGFNLDSGTLTLDVSAGNVTLFVDGNVGLADQRIQVVNGAGTDHYAKVFTTGDVAIAQGNAGVAVESDNATRFQLFGTSELHFGMGQANTYGYTGTVYAPRDGSAAGSNDAVTEYGLSSATAACPADVDTCLGQGNGEVKGAIIGGPASIEQASGFRHDDNLTQVEPSLPGDASLPPPITYLHVSLNRVDVVGATPTGGPLALQATPAPTPTATPTPTPTPTPGGGSAPSIDSFDVTDRSKCTGPGCIGQDYAEFDVAWSVSDPDGDLQTVTVYVNRSGTTQTTYSGASGSETYTETGAYGDGPYGVKVVATDANGNETCEVIEDTTATGDDSDQSRSVC